MKKFLLGLFISVLSIAGYSQTKVYQDWKVENEGEWASFYWGVSRSNYPDYQGKYYYYVYFYSNSYFNTKADGYNHDKAITYIRNIKLYMYQYKYVNGKKYKYNTIEVELPYHTCDWFHDPSVYAAWFWSYSPNVKILMTFDKASVFDYSIY
jgi:hypothetical protein